MTTKRFINEPDPITRHCEICDARPGERCTESDGEHETHITR